MKGNVYVGGQKEKKILSYNPSGDGVKKKLDDEGKDGNDDDEKDDSL